ncbi:hypothetical protein [Caulobacter sp. BP25]|uniref:hypothetical protein n=1 Tax=Caulobacter sp. BP25 TaxID=2048900 RepID=UPI000C129B93|nr:hypothetical protein [Caulobacter sp. BP25]PHY17514.1 hypothetical protein CSW59_18050 [Caulobacter sp. BP25]
MAIGYSSFDTPTSNVVPTWTGGRFAAEFSNTAVFTCGPDETCADGVYRQTVKGEFLVNGSPLTHVLCGPVVLSPTDYEEDGCPPAGDNCDFCTAYGYRQCAMTNDRYTNPDQATGSDFSMEDAPGFNAPLNPLNNYTINLSFEGMLFDIGAGNVLATQTWTVVGSSLSTPTLAATQGEDLVPAQATAEEIGLASTDKLFRVEHTRNRLTGALELHLVIQRAVGSAPLSSKALSVALFDADKEPMIAALGEPSGVYEIGSRSGVTTNVVYKLPPTAPVATWAAVTAVTADGEANRKVRIEELPVIQR